MSRWVAKLRLLKRMNWFMTMAVLLLLTIGVYFIYSACYVSDSFPVRSLYRKQILWGLAGLFCYFSFALLDYRYLRQVAWWIYGGCLVLLMLVLLVGAQVYGARRRLDFGISVQPSEIAKLATIIVLARQLSQPGAPVGQFKLLLAAAATVLLPFLLIVRQPDLGTAMVFLPMVFAIMYVAGVPLRYLTVPVALAAAAVGILVAVLLLPERLGVDEAEQQRIWRFTGLSEYQRDRVRVYLGLDKDPLGAGWNKMQSEIAVGSGGRWGKGFLKGTSNILGFLPRKVAPTDFIYSVIAEEKGFCGSMVVLALLGAVMLFGGQAALVSRDRMGRLLSVGIVVMIFSHVFINIAMTIGLMPITGLPLPLLSYGGSFTIMIMCSLGIVQSVYIRAHRIKL